jgi:nucleoside-diphosphate-sugar epimerase
MKILILGGTLFIGKRFVELIQNKNYNISLANRGVSGKVDIKIDRNNAESCKNLNNSYFDIVVDFSGYNPEQLINVVSNIRFNKYIFISTSGVAFLPFRNVGPEDYEMAAYIFNKKKCEDYIIENISNYNIIRPCYVVGEGDYTERFYKDGSKYFWKNGKELDFYIEVTDLNNIILDCFYKSQNSIVSPCAR